MIGRYPPADISLTALGLGTIIFFISFPIVMGLNTGTIAIISRRWGEKNYREACQVASDAMVTLVLISIPITLFGFFFGPYLIEFMVNITNADIRVVDVTTKYILAVFVFYPFDIFVLIHSGILIGAGDTRTPMYVNVAMNLYNIIANYLLIFGNFGFPELGVMGAGIATGTSYLVGAAIFSIFLFRGRLKIAPIYKWCIKIRLETVRKMFRIGIPAGLDMGMWTISSFFVTPLILYFGSLGYSAYIIGLRAESIAYMPGVGFGVAATTLAGQYLGAKKPKLAKKTVITATKLVMLIMGVLGIVIILLPEQLARVFTSDREVIEIAIIYLILMGFTEPALGAIFTLTGGMRGAGYTKVPLVVNFFGLVVIRLSLLYLLAYALNMGLLGIWVGMLIEMFIRVSLIYLVFQRGGWMNVVV